MIIGTIVNTMGETILYEVIPVPNNTYVSCVSFEVQAAPLDVGTNQTIDNSRKTVCATDTLADWPFGTQPGDCLSLDNTPKEVSFMDQVTQLNIDTGIKPISWPTSDGLTCIHVYTCMHMYRHVYT